MEPVDQDVGERVGLLPLGQAQDDHVPRVAFHQRRGRGLAAGADDDVALPRTRDPQCGVFGTVIDGHHPHDPAPGPLPKRVTTPARGLLRAELDTLAGQLALRVGDFIHR